MRTPPSRTQALKEKKKKKENLGKIWEKRGVMYIYLQRVEGGKKGIESDFRIMTKREQKKKNKGGNALQILVCVFFFAVLYEL